MTPTRRLARFVCAPLALSSSLWLAAVPAAANPSGAQVYFGQATVSGQGTAHVHVDQASQNAILSWQSFNIESGETTSFQQPNANAVAINRILDQNPSHILGTLQANGHVYLINPSGVLFGKGSRVDVHALIATTTFDGAKLRALTSGFDPSAQPSPGARIQNEGTIHTGTGGSVYLVAPVVENGSDGVIVSPGGEIHLAAGSTVYLTDRLDGLGVAVEYTAPATPGSETVNLGQIIADGGLARLRADLVTQAGVVQADSVREHNGVVELVAGSDLALTDGSVTGARGGSDPGSSAGRIDAWSDGDASVAPGATVDVSASADGADGGFAEISSAGRVSVNGHFEAGGGAGGSAGEVLIDPATIDIGNVAFSNARRVLLEASQLITVNQSLDLAADARQDHSQTEQTLTLRSEGAISFAQGAVIRDDGSGTTTSGAPKKWNVELVAGADGTKGVNGSSPDADVLALGPGSGGNVTFAPGSGIELTRGDLDLLATGNVRLESGAHLSDVEGDINVLAGGDVVFAPARDMVFGGGFRQLAPETLIENGSGNIAVVAGGSVLLQPPAASVPLGQQRGGNAAIRTRGIRGTTAAGLETRENGGSILVWARTGKVDAGVGNRWLEPGANDFDPANDPFLSFRTQPAPSFDVMPVVRTIDDGNSQTGANPGESGVLGIGTEAGGNVVVLAGDDIVTRDAMAPQRLRGTAGNEGTTYDGAHIGVFGVPVAFDTDPVLGRTGPVPLPGAPQGRLLAIAGGDLRGDFAIRNGQATLLGGYTLRDQTDPLRLDPTARAARLAELLALAGKTRAELRDVQGAAGTPDLLDISPIARADGNRGWAGSLGTPITVDLIDASVDLLGRNGVAVRAIENPSLVYPTLLGVRVPSYGPNDSALLEAETGDVVMVGGDPLREGGGTSDLPYLLPPSVTVRTHPDDGQGPTTGAGALGGRPGDLVMLRDFVLHPSEQGGLTVDVAGKARTANGAASGSAKIEIRSALALRNDFSSSITLPAGSRLLDPRTGNILTLSGPLEILPPLPALPGKASATFRVLPAYQDQRIVIPAGTRVRDLQGRLFTSTTEQVLEAPANRLSEGTVTVVAASAPQASGILIPANTEFVAADGTRFVATTTVSIDPGRLSAEVPVRALTPGVDAPAGSLRLADPQAFPMLVRATNFAPIQRLPFFTASFLADLSGQLRGPQQAFTVTQILDPVPGLELVSGQSRSGGGSDRSPFGQQAPDNTVLASTPLVGPAGVPSFNTDLVLLDTAALPPGFSASDLRIQASGAQGDSGVTPVVFRQVQAGRRPDGPPDKLTLVTDPTQIWRGGASSSASLVQSEADPDVDARDPSSTFDYQQYFATCILGAPCGQTVAGVVARTTPTHLADTTPASLSADLGFERIRFRLAEAAILQTQHGDVLDLQLQTRHSASGQVTQVLVPRGSASFAGQSRVIEDDQLVAQGGQPIRLTLDGDRQSGVQVAGPGRLELRIGVVPFDQADANQDGRIEFAEFGGSRELFDHLDTFPDGVLTPNEASWIPTGTGGVLALSDATGSANQSLGIRTVGNLVNPALPVGGADIDVLVEGQIALNRRGAIGLVQGGHIRIESLDGGVTGGNVAAGVSGQRGIYSIAFQAPTVPQGDIQIFTAGDFDLGGTALASLSGGNILVATRNGSIRAGRGAAFKNAQVFFDPNGGLFVGFDGSGIYAAPPGTVTLQARRGNVDIGAGIAGAAIAISAQNVTSSGSGSISAGTVTIDVSGSVSGSIQATGNVSVSAGGGTTGANISAGGLVVGAGSVASNSTGGKTTLETAVTADRLANLAAARSTEEARTTRKKRRGVIIEVSVAPADGGTGSGSDAPAVGNP